MLELIIIVLLILWLVGYFGPRPFGRGGLIHLLLIIILILVIIRLIH